MKTAGLLLLFLIPVSIGVKQYIRLYRISEFWGEFQLFIKHLKTTIRYSYRTIEAIISEYALRHKGFLIADKVNEMCINGEGLPDAWSAAVLYCEKSLQLKYDDIILIKGFGEGLGSSDAEGQMLHLNLYNDRISGKLTEAIDERKQKGKLYIILGILAGLGIDLILI